MAPLKSWFATRGLRIVNTVSNLAYAVAGGVLVRSDPTPRHWVLFAALLWLAIGSSGFHWTASRFWNDVDWSGMLAVMVGLALKSGFPYADETALAIAMVVLGVLLSFLFGFRAKHFDAVMGALLLAAAIPCWLYGNRGMVYASLGCFAVAYGAWQLDRIKGAGYFHGLVWHPGTAAAILLMALAR